jgi:hypothetical protein
MVSLQEVVALQEVSSLTGSVITPAGDADLLAIPSGNAIKLSVLVADLLLLLFPIKFVRRLWIMILATARADLRLVVKDILFFPRRSKVLRLSRKGLRNH